MKKISFTRLGLETWKILKRKLAETCRRTNVSDNKLKQMFWNKALRNLKCNKTRAVVEEIKADDRENVECY